MSIPYLLGVPNGKPLDQVTIPREYRLHPSERGGIKLECNDRNSSVDILANNADIEKSSTDIPESSADMEKNSVDIPESSADMEKSSADIPESSADMEESSVDFFESSAAFPVVFHIARRCDLLFCGPEVDSGSNHVAGRKKVTFLAANPKELCEVCQFS